MTETNNHITEYLHYYTDLNNPQYAVLLKGNWGCGKTFYIKNLIAEWETHRKSSSKIILNPIYISLNGVVNAYEINEKIRETINPLLYSRGMEYAKKMATGLLHTAVRVDMGFDGDNKKNGNYSLNVDVLGLLNTPNKCVKGKRILVFDDLERCNMKMDEIFGYINNFVEHQAFTVILLTDERKLKAKYEQEKPHAQASYKDYKEKVVGQSFEVKSDIRTILDSCIKEIYSVKGGVNLVVFKQLIIELFAASKLDNLRVFKLALLDFNRFTAAIDPYYKQQNNYHHFIKHLLAYYLVVYIESKTGNEAIGDFKTVFINTGEEKELHEEIAKKYQPIWQRNGIKQVASIMPLNVILNFIEDGHVTRAVLNNALGNNSFFKVDYKNTWETLYSWKTMEDINFMKLRDLFWKRFTKGQVGDIYVLFHLTGVFLKLIDEHLFSKKKEVVIKYAVSNMTKIIGTRVIAPSNFINGVENLALGHVYQSCETEEFKSLKKRFLDMLHAKYTNTETNFLKTYFEKINTESRKSMPDLLKVSTPDGRTTYEKTAIFEEVDGKLMGKRIKLMENESIDWLKRFFYTRYHPKMTDTGKGLEDYHKEDKHCLVELRKELKTGVVKTKAIKNKLLKEFVVVIEQCIAKIDAV